MTKTLPARAAKTTDLQGICTQGSTKTDLGTNRVLLEHTTAIEYLAQLKA
jgi:hypothetical protein